MWAPSSSYWTAPSYWGPGSTTYWDGRWPFKPTHVDPARSCIHNSSREGVLFLERDCAAFPVGQRCCAGHREVTSCYGNVEGGMSVGALHCLQRDD